MLLACREEAPPQTPEHASVLKCFVVAALRRLEAELQEHCNLAKAAAKPACSTDGSSSSRSSGSSNSRTCSLQKLWAHARSHDVPQTPQQQQQQQPQCVGASAGEPDLLPAAHKVCSWLLTPHIDLQVQAPPLLLLQRLVLRAAQLCRDQQPGHSRPAAPSESLQQQQQQQQQQDQDSGTSMLLDALHQLQQQQQQYQADFMSEAWATLLDGSPVVQQLQSAFETHSSAAGVPTQSAAPGAVGQQLCHAATTLAARYLVQQVLPVNQQLQEGIPGVHGDPTLALQALQLLAAVRQLQATAQAVASLEAVVAAAAAAPGCDLASCVRDEQRAKQLLMQQCLTLQLVRALGEVPAGSAAALDTSNSTEAYTSSSSGGGGSRGCAGSSCSQAMSPTAFFAADGPLSSCWGQQVPSAATGLWEGTYAAGNTDQPAAVSAAAAACHSGQPMQRMMACLLNASAIACTQQCRVSGVLGDLLQS